MKTVIIKIGSSSLVSEEWVRKHVFVDIAKKLQELMKTKKCILVSSWAVAVWKNLLGGEKEKQLYAWRGQVELMRLRQDACDIYDIDLSQFLVSRYDITEHSSRVKDGITASITQWSLAVVNDNDAIYKNEWRDNDMLAWSIAQLMDASQIIFISDIDAISGIDSNGEHLSLSLFDKEIIEWFTVIDRWWSSLWTWGIMSKWNVICWSVSHWIDVSVCSYKSVDSIVSDV